MDEVIKGEVSKIFLSVEKPLVIHQRYQKKIPEIKMVNCGYCHDLALVNMGQSSGTEQIQWFKDSGSTAPSSGPINCEIVRAASAFLLHEICNFDEHSHTATTTFIWPTEPSRRDYKLIAME